MKNPLLVPELRDMLGSNRIDEIRDFAAFTPPEVAAEFISALAPDEQRSMLSLLEQSTRAQIFAGFDDDAKLTLLDALPDEDALGLVGELPEEARDHFLEYVPREHRLQLRDRFQSTRKGEATAVVEAIEETLAPAPPPTAEAIATEVNQHLETYRFARGGTERVARPEKGCWVRIANPSKDNLPLIADHFKVPLDFLTAALDVDETARIEVDESATLFIVKIPYFDEKNVDVLYFTIPVGIILTKGLVITVCTRQTSLMDDFAANKVRNVIGGHRFLLQLVLRATVRYLQYLKQLNNAANIIQKKLEQESRNRQLIKLFNIEKSLVYFTTSLKSNMVMLGRLRRMQILETNDFNENLLEDIFTECQQAIDMANVYSDILSGMMDAFASVISNNLNIVMKLLTSITIIITIPVMVTSIFGMNVKLPFQDHPYAFLIVLGISVLLSLAAVIYFVKRRWLEP